MFDKSIYVSVALIALQTLALNSNAATNDRKSYPGSYCVEIHDTTSEAWYDSLSRLRNDATGANTFVCGAILDHGSAKDISVNVLDANPQAGKVVSCIGQTRNETGGLGSWTQTVSSTGGGHQRLSLGSLNNKPSRGYHFVRCSVPGKFNGARSGINSYYIRERD